jgi:hypothetical protein
MKFFEYFVTARYLYYLSFYYLPLFLLVTYKKCIDKSNIKSKSNHYLKKISEKTLTPIISFLFQIRIRTEFSHSLYLLTLKDKMIFTRLMILNLIRYNCGIMTK